MMRQVMRGTWGLLAAMWVCGAASAADVATIEIKPKKQWDDGYVADVVIRNISPDPISGWTLRFDLGNKLRRAYSAQYSGKGSYRFRNLSYNGRIRPGGTERFGIVVDGDFSKERARNCQLNGKPCRFVFGDTLPEIASVSSPSAAEGTALEFQVALSGKSSQTTPVHIELQGIEATLGVDTGALSVVYPGLAPVALSGAVADLSVPANTVKFKLVLDTVKDAVAEGQERVKLFAGVAVSNISTRSAEDGGAVKTGIGTISDDVPPQAQLSIQNAASAKEGEKASCTVALSGSTTAPVTVKYETVAGTASASDFTPLSGQLTFTAASSQTLAVQALTDAVNPEADETLKLRLSEASGAQLGNSECLITIRNAESPQTPVLNVQDASTVAEGEVAVFSVRLAGMPTDKVTVKYQTVDGDAKAASGDYVAASGELTFAAGVADQTATVRINTTKDAQNGEAVESFLLRLSEPVAATIGRGEAKAMITDSSVGLPKVSITGPQQPVKEGEVATFVVSLSGKPSAPVEVDYATADGKAVAGADYTTTSGHLVFAKDDAVLTRSVTVKTLTDAQSEGSEGFSLKLANVKGGELLTASADATITDQAAPVAVYKRTFDPMKIGSLWLKNLESEKIKNEGKNGAAGPDARKGEPDVVIARCPDAKDDSQKCLEVRYHHGDDKGGIIKHLPISPAYKCKGDKCEWVVNTAYTNTGTDVFQRNIHIPETDIANEAGTATDKVRPAKAYTLSYDIYFDKGFDFARGGKLPGLAAAVADSGCTDDASDKRGPDNWSVRLMWRANGRMELYSYDQSRVAGKCGNRYILGVLDSYATTKECTNEIPGNVGVCLVGDPPPANVFRFKPETWYTVRLSVQVNDKITKRVSGEPTMDGGDGKITLFVKKRGSDEAPASIELLNVPLRDQCDKNGENCVNQIADKPATQVNDFFFSTFFGGNETKRKVCMDPNTPESVKENSICKDQKDNQYSKYSWEPSRRSVAYFDNIEIREGYMNRDKLSQF